MDITMKYEELTEEDIQSIKEENEKSIFHAIVYLRAKYGLNLKTANHLVRCVV